MHIMKSGRLEDRRILWRWIGLILLLAASVGLCITAGAGEDADHWIKEGYKQMWKGSLDQANESFAKALEIYNEEIAAGQGDSNATLNATNKKVLLLVRLERFDEAILTLDRAIKSNPENPEAWKSKGFALINIAEKIAEKSTAESNAAKSSVAESGIAENSTAGNNTVQLESTYNQSLQAFQRTLDLNPGDAEAWRGLALAHSGLKDHGDALKASDRAVEIDPGNGQAWLDRGILLLQMGQAEEALFALDRALSIDPDNLDALSMKAEALSSLGRYQEAEAAFSTAMDMNSMSYETGDPNVDWLV